MVSCWNADDGTCIWLHIQLPDGCTEHIAFATCFMPPRQADVLSVQPLKARASAS